MVVGISLVKDEVDIIEHTVTRMLAQVDHVMVLDNGSVDGTREILDRLDVDVFDDPDPAHYQSRKTSWLAAKAAERGATWVVAFDADEVWRSRRRGTIARTLRALPDTVLLAEATLYDHVATALDPDGDPLARMRWRRTSPCAMRKVACRTRPDLVIHEGNHMASYEGLSCAPAVLDCLVVRHFPYRSPEQFVTKARNGSAALAATSLPEGIGKHWRDYGRLLDAHGPEVLREMFHEHFWSADPERDGLTYDPCP